MLCLNKGLLLLVVGLGGLVLVRGIMFTELEAEEMLIVSKADWVGVCLSSEYEIPDLAIQKFAGHSCWNGAEVPNDTIYIAYLLKSGECSRTAVTGHFLERAWTETRCFKRAEIAGARLVNTNGVYHFSKTSADANSG